MNEREIALLYDRIAVLQYVRFLDNHWRTRATDYDPREVKLRGSALAHGP